MMPTSRIARSSRSRQSRRTAVARIEVLTLITALAIFIAMTTRLPELLELPARSAECFENLREIGRISALVATSDARWIPHRQSSAGLQNWRGLGAFDWGGADGMAGEFGPNCTLPSGACMPAITRPYNAFVQPAQYADIFRCPSDMGDAAVPAQNFSHQSTPPGSELFKKAIYLASGNSYSGDSIWLSASGGPVPSSRRFGSFMRPIQRFPMPAETLLFYEARFSQAFLSSTESVTGGGGVGQPVEIQSWHGRQKHNALMVDGHTQAIELRMTGSMIPTDSFPLDLYPDRNVMYRGSGWRYDTFPEQPVFEHGAGDPLPPNASASPAIHVHPERINSTTPP